MEERSERNLKKKGMREYPQQRGKRETTRGRFILNPSGFRFGKTTREGFLGPPGGTHNWGNGGDKFLRKKDRENMKVGKKVRGV